MPGTNGENWLRVIERCQKDAQGWCCCPGLTFQEAEALLDWLEAIGICQREARLGEGGVVVRWQPGSGANRP